SGIYKLTPDGSFTAVRTFTPLLLSGDKWRLAADGNTLEGFLNGVSQFTYTTDGSYPSGDVGIETHTAAFTLLKFEGGSNGPAPPPPPPDTQPPTAPGMLTAVPAASNQINLMWRAATDNVGVTGYRVERCLGVACSAFVQVGTTSATSYSDAG